MREMRRQGKASKTVNVITNIVVAVTVRATSVARAKTIVAVTVTRMIYVVPIE